MKKLKIISHFTRDRSGASAAELALVLPFLLFMLVGAIEIGRLLHDYQVVSKGVRDSARYLARQDWNCGSAGAAVGTFSDTFQVTVAKHLALTGQIDVGGVAGKSLTASPPAADLSLGYWSDPNSITVEIDCVNRTNAAITGGAFQGAYLESGDYVPIVRVEADVPFTMLFGFWTLGDLKIDHTEAGIGS